MGTQFGSRHPRRYVEDGGTKVDIGAANVATTGLTEGNLYRLTCLGDSSVAAHGGAACAWGTADAADTTGSFDFVIAHGESMVVEAQHSELNIIGADGTTVGAVYIQELQAEY